MDYPVARTDSPPGLESLNNADQLQVVQEVGCSSICSDSYMYNIKNRLGETVYWASSTEENDCCFLVAFPFLQHRWPHMKIMDINRNTVINTRIPLPRPCLSFPCCMQSIELTTTPGDPIGSLKEERLCSKFSLKNGYGDTVMRIEGRFSRLPLRCNVEFKVGLLTCAVVGIVVNVCAYLPPDHYQRWRTGGKNLRNSHIIG